MNKTILMGRLTKDVDLRYSQSQEPIAIAKFSIAVARKFKKQNETDADFINCVSFGKVAENISRFFSKGRMISVIGRIQCGSYENKDGQKIYTTDIIVEEFNFTGEKKGEGADDPVQDWNPFEADVLDEDLPF